MYKRQVLYYADEVPQRYKWILDINPLAGLLTAWSDVIILGHAPEASALGLSVAWAFGIFLVGAAFFISREREFAVRL